MAFRLPRLGHRSLHTPLLVGSLTGASLCLAQPLLAPRRPMLLDAWPTPVSAPQDRTAARPRGRDGATTARRRSLGRTARQLSAGSTLGLVSGLAVSALWCRPLALLVGLLVVGVRAAEARGIRLVPCQTLRRWAAGVEVGRAVRDNVAFTVGFGVVFALTAFARLPR